MGHAILSAYLYYLTGGNGSLAKRILILKQGNLPHLVFMQNGASGRKEEAEAMCRSAFPSGLLEMTNLGGSPIGSWYGLGLMPYERSEQARTFTKVPEEGLLS